MLDLKKVKDLGISAAGKAAKRAKEGVKKGAAANGGSNEQYLVGLDIGTEYVKALIGKINPDNSIDIIGVGREHQNLTDMQAGAVADIAGVVRNCDEALAKAESQAGVSVRTAVIGIAGELVKGTTSTVRISRKDASKPIDIPEMEKIIRLVQERAESRARQQMSLELSGGKDVGVRLVNSALVSIEIDGYPVTNPIDFTGRDVVVQLYTAFAPMIHIGALERVAQQLDIDLLAVAAEPFAVARSVIGDEANTSFSAVLMDVGGGTTDIAVINEGGVQGTKMFGIGGRAYSKAVERDLGVEYGIAEKLKLGIGNGSIPPNKAKAVENSLRKTLDVWTGGVELALSEFPQLDTLPHRLLLCGGGSSLEMLMEALQRTDWYRDLPFARKPVVQHIQPSQVVGIKDTTGYIQDHTFITAMGLLRVGLDTMQYAGSGGQSSVREKIDRILQT